MLYATAQPMTKLDDSGTTVYYFAAVRGIKAEFAFVAGDLQSIKASSGVLHSEGGVRYVSGIEPGVESGVDARIDLVAKSGQSTRLVVLSADEAEHAWKVRLGGAERLLITAQNVAPAANDAIRLRSLGDTHFAFTLTPAPKQAPQATLPLTRGAVNRTSSEYLATAEERHLEFEIQPIKPAGVAPPVKLAPPPSWRAGAVAQAPEEGELPLAAQWQVTIPENFVDGISDAILRIRYQGDVARLFAGDHLLTDDFFNGLDWNVGLKRFVAQESGNKLRLSILPLRKDAPVYFESPRKIEFGANDQAVQLESVHLLPEYELVLGGAEK
jgi:hypothetical protein